MKVPSWRLASASAVITLLTRLPVGSDAVSGWEEAAFRVINGAPDVPYILPWLFMQVGNVMATAIAAATAARRRLYVLACSLVVGGIGTWLLAKVLKRMVERGRPAAVLDDVILRRADDSGGGWVSGHAAVTAALLTIAWPDLPRRWRYTLVALVAPMYFARIYVGEHLPLDMAGGASFGILCGTAVSMIQRHAGRSNPLRTTGMLGRGGRPGQRRRRQVRRRRRDRALRPWLDDRRSSIIVAWLELPSVNRRPRR